MLRQEQNASATRPSPAAKAECHTSWLKCPVLYFCVSATCLGINCSVSLKTQLMTVIVFSALINLSLATQKHRIIANEKGQTYKTPPY